MYAVVITYNFDKTTPVFLCETIEDARIKLKEQFLHELEIDLMENEWDTETAIDSDSEYAKIVNHFPDHDDITEYRIGDTIGGENIYEKIIDYMVFEENTSKSYPFAKAPRNITIMEMEKIIAQVEDADSTDDIYNAIINVIGKA